MLSLPWEIQNEVSASGNWKSLEAWQCKKASSNHDAEHVAITLGSNDPTAESPIPGNSAGNRWGFCKEHSVVLSSDEDDRGCSFQLKCFERLQPRS